MPGVTRLPGAGACPVTMAKARAALALAALAFVRAAGAGPGMLESELGGVVTERVLRPEAAMRAVASGRVIPVRSGMA